MAFQTVGVKPQTQLLLEHFQVRADISGDEARNMFRIKSLPRRILDLEKQGYRFSKVPKQDSTGQRYTRYYFHGHSGEATA